MARSAELLVKIAVDAAAAARDTDAAASRFGKFGSAMSGLAAPAAATGAALVAFGKFAVDAASSVQQALGATQTVFGDNADQVTAWSKDAASSAGLAQSAYLELANVVGAQLGNMGVSADDAARQTNDLITMGADLAATFGGSTADAVGALSSALKGEADPAEKYGLNLSAAAVAAQMAADGTDKLTGEARTAAKAQTILAMATKQSGAAVGAFAREADTAEGASARASATWENTQATLGQVLLPAVTMVSTALGVMAGWMQDNATAVQIVVGVLGGLALAVLAVNAAMKVAAAGQVVWTAIQNAGKVATAVMTAAQWALNAAMSANPVMLVVIAVAALVAGIILLWKNSAAFRSFVIGMWQKIQQVAVATWNRIRAIASSVIGAITGAVSRAGSAIGAVWNRVAAIASAAFQGIRTVVGWVVGAITGAIGAAGETISAVWHRVQAITSSVWQSIRSVVSSVVQGVVGIVQGIVGAVSGAWNSILGAARSAWEGVKSAASGAFAAISGFVSTMSSAIQSIFNTILGAGTAVWNSIRNAAQSALGGIQSIISSISGAIDSMLGGIQTALSWVGDLWGKITGASNAAANVPKGVSSPVGFAAAPAPTGRALGTPTSRAGTTATAAAAGPTIIIQGALDPDAVARQVQSILRRRSRRVGGVSV